MRRSLSFLTMANQREGRSIGNRRDAPPTTLLRCRPASAMVSRSANPSRFFLAVAARSCVAWVVPQALELRSPEATVESAQLHPAQSLPPQTSTCRCWSPRNHKDAFICRRRSWHRILEDCGSFRDVNRRQVDIVMRVETHGLGILQTDRNIDTLRLLDMQGQTKLSETV